MQHARDNICYDANEKYSLADVERFFARTIIVHGFDPYVLKRRKSHLFLNCRLQPLDERLQGRQIGLCLLIILVTDELEQFLK